MVIKFSLHHAKKMSREQFVLVLPPAEFYMTNLVNW